GSPAFPLPTSTSTSCSSPPSSLSPAGRGRPTASCASSSRPLPLRRARRLPGLRSGISLRDALRGVERRALRSRRPQLLGGGLPLLPDRRPLRRTLRDLVVLRKRGARTDGGAAEGSGETQEAEKRFLGLSSSLAAEVAVVGDLVFLELRDQRAARDVQDGGGAALIPLDAAHGAVDHLAGDRVHDLLQV